MAEKMFKPVPIEQEPKRENRFVVEFPSEFGIESYVVQKINKPRIQFVSTPYKNPDGSHTIINSDYKWDNFEIEFLDIIGPSTSAKLLNMVNICKNRREKIADKKAPLFTFYIKSLDPTGVEIEKWKITVAELLDVNFGDLDYGSDKLQFCKVVLKPLDCELEY
jgi:hypothetical protein